MCPSDLAPGGQLGNPFIGAISFSWLIRESTLAYMDSLLRWNYAPWDYSVRVNSISGCALCCEENCRAVSKASEDLEGFDWGFTLNSDANIRIRELFVV